MRIRAGWVLLAAALVAACSGIPRRESDQEALARYMDYAGAPVDRFSVLGRVDGWRPLGRNKLIVWTGVNEAYLLTVAEPCFDLEFAHSVSLTSTGSSVSRGFDSVKVGRDRCMITEIRPIDYQQMKADQRAAGGG